MKTPAMNSGGCNMGGGEVFFFFAKLEAVYALALLTYMACASRP
jgi:hypothetical protein